MAFTDHVIRENVISSEDTVIDMQEFVDHIKDWFVNNGYRINEKTYLALPGSKTQIKWECTRKTDDYHKFILAVKFDLKAKQEAKGKRKLSKGNVQFTHGAKLERDYDNKWVGAWKLITRAIFDRFVMEETEKSVLKELENDVSRLKKTAKQYLVV